MAKNCKTCGSKNQPSSSYTKQLNAALIKTTTTTTKSNTITVNGVKYNPA